MIWQIKNFFLKIKKLIEFAPAVWKHEDWDYSYIINFNIYLLERLQKSIFHNGHHLPAKHDERKLVTVIELLKRINNEDVEVEEVWQTYKKHGVDITMFGNLNRPRSPELTKDLHRVREKYKKTKELEAQLLFKLLKTQGKKWWD